MDCEVGASGFPKAARGGPNPKPEGRRPKEPRNPNSEKDLLRGMVALLERLPVRISVFGLPSAFGFRPSDFRAAGFVLASASLTSGQPWLAAYARKNGLLRGWLSGQDRRVYQHEPRHLSSHWCAVRHGERRR